MQGCEHNGLFQRTAAFALQHVQRPVGQHLQGGAHDECDQRAIQGLAGVVLNQVQCFACALVSAQLRAKVLQLRQGLVPVHGQPASAQAVADLSHFGKVLVLPGGAQGLQRQVLVGPQETGGFTQVHPADQFGVVGHVGRAVWQVATNLGVDAVDPLDALQSRSRAAISGGGHKQGRAPQSRLQLGAKTRVVPHGPQSLRVQRLQHQRGQAPGHHGHKVRVHLPRGRVRTEQAGVACGL